MRAELQQLEQIDAYLNGSMDAQAKARFETEMNQSAGLREIVENQRLIIRTVQRQALLAEINQFSSTSGTWTLAKWLSVVLVATGLIAAGIYWKYRGSDNEAIAAETKATLSEVDELVATISESDSADWMVAGNIPSSGQVIAMDAEENPTPMFVNSSRVAPAEMVHKSFLKAVSMNDFKSEYFELGKYTPLQPFLDGLKTWIEPKTQYFDVDPKKGETIECEDGTLVIVPADAFLNKEGEIIVEHVRIEIVEALSVADMLAYNLTTMNGDKHLQSGGMIYVQPTVNGEKVAINPERPLHIEIPTETEIPGMLAWKGETDAQGNINWVDPKPLEKFLTPVKFEKLDFLPPGFADEVEASLPFRSHKKMSRELADSLYYSLAESDKSFVASSKDMMNTKNEIIYTKKNTYAFSGKVIDHVNDKPLQGAKVRIYSYTEPDEGRQGHYDSSRVAQELEWAKKEVKSEQKHKAVPTSTLIDSLMSAEDGSFSLVNMKEKFVYFVIEHPDFQKFVSSDLILPINQTLTFQPVVKLKRVNFSMATPLANQVVQSAFMDSSAICMIDPLSIKAIRTKAFAKTFLATKEFEERIQVLHQMPNPQHLLTIYVGNLNGDLWLADSLVALQLGGKNKVRFQDFAAQKKTNVKNKNIYEEQLSAYYNKKRDDYVATMAKMAAEFKSKSGEDLDKMEQKVNLLRKSYATSGFEQPEIPAEKAADYRAVQPNVAVNYSYSVNWYQPGWMNIDSYNSLLANGSKSVSISVNDKPQARIYQSINPLKTIVPLSVQNGKATAKFPQHDEPGSEQMKNTFCIGIQKINGEISYAEQHYDPYVNGEIQLEWEPVSEKKLHAALRALPDADNKFVSFLKTQEKQIKRQQEIQAKQEALALEMKLLKEKIAQEKAFIGRLKIIARSCGIKSAGANDYDIDLSTDKIGPEFPGGRDALVRFINKRLKFSEESQMCSTASCYVNFSVATDGSISDIVIVKGIENCPECDQEVVSMILSMPKWDVSKIKGKSFTSGHKFHVEIDIANLHMNGSTYKSNLIPCANGKLSE